MPARETSSAPAAPGVERFLERLSGLAPADWLAAGDAATTDAARRTASRAVLDALVERHCLRVEAWYLRDAVETAACHCLPARGMHSPGRAAIERRDAAVRAATDAALALLTQPLMADDDFEALYRPFAALIPAPRAGPQQRPPAPPSRCRETRRG